MPGVGYPKPKVERLWRAVAHWTQSLHKVIGAIRRSAWTFLPKLSAHPSLIRLNLRGLTQEEEEAAAEDVEEAVVSARTQSVGSVVTGLKMEPHGVFKEITKLCTEKVHCQSVLVVITPRTVLWNWGALREVPLE